MADVKKLRKLRATEQEKVISGAEYEERLRAKCVRLPLVWSVPLLHLLLNLLLLRRFNELNPPAAWAQLPEKKTGSTHPDVRWLALSSWLACRTAGDGSDDEDGGEDAATAFLSNTQSMLAKSGSKLMQGTLHVTRVKDANIAEISQVRHASVVPPRADDLACPLSSVGGGAERQVPPERPAADDRGHGQDRAALPGKRISQSLLPVLMLCAMTGGWREERQGSRHLFPWCAHARVPFRNSRLTDSALFRHADFVRRVLAGRARGDCGRAA